MPQVTAAVVPPIELLRIAGMCAHHKPRQRSLASRHGNQMHVVAHPTPAQQRDGAGIKALDQQFLVAAPVFLTDETRRRYQELLLKSLEPCRAELLGWCWMSNHVHLVVVPRREDSLSRLIRRVHSAYAQDFNRRRSRDGHVWRSRFYSCALGPNRLEAALLYVDLNPVRAGLTGEATAWE